MVLSNSQWLANSSTGADVVSVGNSALFSTTSQELERTPSGAGNLDTWTFSAWVYFCAPTGASSKPIFGAINGSANQQRLMLTNTGNLQFDWYSSSSYVGRLITTQFLRDLNWYHIVAVYDSGNSVSSQRQRLYLNGKRITAFGTEVYVSQNLDGLVNSAVLHQIGLHDGLTLSTDGYIAESVLLDGTAAEPTSFGAYDSSGLYWTPKSSDAIKALTFGTNGFYLDNTTNAQTDASGEGHNWTNTGSVTTNPHSPTNSYPVQNPLTLTNSYPSSLANGNLKQTGSSSGSFASGTLATLPCDGGGKFYWEIKVVSMYTTNGYSSIGVAPMDLPRFDNTDGNGNFCLPGQQDYQGVSTTFNTGTLTNLRGNSLAVNSNIGSAYAVSTGAFMQIAFDSATQKVWFGKNNTWYNSGDPAAGSNETITLTATDKTWFPWIGTYTASDIFELNYGATDFEYTPPTGFNSLNTTQLASDTTRTASDTTKYFETILYEGDGQGQRVGQFQPFGDSFTVAKSGLWSASSADLTRGSMSGTGTTWTFSAWVKRAEPAVGSATANFVFTTASDAGLAFGGAGTADEVAWYSGSYTGATNSDLVNDQSQWYHVVVKNDGGTGTIYLNGNEVLGSVTVNAADATMAIGSYNGSSNEFDGYISEVVFVESALAPTSFAKTDTSTNRWVPIDVSGLTYSGNSFYLNFADSSDLGNDVSGNNKDFTNNSGVLSSTDSPTTNIATLSATDKSSGITLSNGNRTFAATTNQNVHGTIPLPSSGKYYWEVNLDTASSASVGVFLALNKGNEAMTTATSGWGTAVALYRAANGNVYVDGTSIFTLSGVSAVNTTWQVAVDLDNNKMWFGIDNTWMSSTAITGGNPSTGANPVLIRDFTGYKPLFGNYSNTMTVDFDSANWGYTAPTGFVELSQDNLPSSDQFITAFSWIKNRDATDNHMLFDRVRGVTKDMHSNDTAAEVTNVNTLQQFLAGGVQVGNDVEVNTANESYVLWNFMMEATGSGSSYTAGSINTTALVDTTLGMSVGTFTGTGSANETIETGLTGCEMIIVKRTNATYGWAVWHSGLTDDYSLLLNTNAAQVSSGYWDTSGNTSTLIELGTDSEAVNKASQPYNFIAFAPSQFISIGSYKGNANANGTFRPTLNSLGIPIQPVWVLIKNTASAQSWWIRDTVRNPYNIITAELHPDLNNAEYQSSTMDIVTGGLKQRVNSDSNSDAIFVYMAIGTPIIDTDGRIIAGR